MNFISWIILIIVLAWLLFAIRYYFFGGSKKKQHNNPKSLPPADNSPDDVCALPDSAFELPSMCKGCSKGSCVGCEAWQENQQKPR